MTLRIKNLAAIGCFGPNAVVAFYPTNSINPMTPFAVCAGLRESAVIGFFGLLAFQRHPRQAYSANGRRTDSELIRLRPK